MAQQPTSASAAATGNATGSRNGRRERFRVWRGAREEAPVPAGAGETGGTALELADARATSVVGDEVAARRSLVGRLRGGRVDLRQGVTGLALGRDVHVRQGAAGILAGGRLTAEQAGSQWLVGGLVQARQVFAVAVVAGKIEGQVRCLFDARGAFAFGAGVALATGLLRLFTRRR